MNTVKYQPWCYVSLPQVIGPYHLVKQLAVGGQAEVWFAYRKGPGGFRRKYAIKLLLPPNSIEAGPRNAFIAEARLMSNFDHPQLLSITDLGELPEQQILYSAMPYVSGLPLSTILKKSQNIELPHALWILHKLMCALNYVHHLSDARGRSLNISHRDITPENIIIGFDGQIKLIDFGIALSAITPRNTRIHHIKGKLNYLSPEQAHGEATDSRTDIYSAALIFYTMLTGTNPLFGDPLSALKRARHPKFQRFNTFLSVPKEIVTQWESMIAKNPNHRANHAGVIATGLIESLRRLVPNYELPHFNTWVKTRFAKEASKEQLFLNTQNKGTLIIETPKEK